MTVLHLISAFPPITETFILREILLLRKAGLNVVIAPLRPLHRTPPAQGFDELASSVIQASWFSVDLLWAFFYFAFTRPLRVIECLSIILSSINTPQNFFKMLYVLLASMRVGYRCRGMSIDLIRADFLHTQALAARFLHALLGTRYAITVYTIKIHYSRKVIQDIVARASWFVADTHQTYAFLKSFAVSFSRIVLLRNGVSLDEFPRRLHEPTVNPPVVLGVGTLIPKKGFHDLLKACRILASRNIRFQCVLIGDGYERQRLEKLKKDFALNDAVEILGYLSLSELHDWYYKASMLVMPSIVDETGDTDGLPTVVIEALAAGLPVIGTSTAGIPEIIEDGVSGILAPVHSPESLADAIQKLLHNPEMREKLSVTGRIRVEQDFNLDRKISNLFDLITGSAVESIEPDSPKGQLFVAG